MLPYAGQLPGVVHGRLCDCTAVADPALTAAVGTALRSSTNLAATIVTSNRAAAIAALSVITERRAGCLKCLIVEERGRGGEERGERARVLAAWRARGAVPLTDTLRARPGHEAALSTVAELLRNWVVVDAWQEAEQCSAEQKRLERKFGLVTRCACPPPSQPFLPCLATFAAVAKFPAAVAVMLPCYSENGRLGEYASPLLCQFAAPVQ